MKKNLTLILLLFTTVLVFAQTSSVITDQRVRQVGEDFIIDFNMQIKGADQWCALDVYLSVDGGETYKPTPLKAISENANHINYSGDIEIVWSANEEDFRIMPGDNLAFKIDVRINTNKAKLELQGVSIVDKGAGLKAVNNTPDGKFQKGEVVQAQITIKNVGLAPAESIEYTIRSNDPNVFFPSNTNFANKEIKGTLKDLKIGEVAEIRVKLSANNNYEHKGEYLPIYITVNESLEEGDIINKNLPIPLFKTAKIKLESSFIMMATVGLSPQLFKGSSDSETKGMMSYGLGIGYQFGRLGVYGKFRSNFNFQKTNYSAMPEDIWATGESKVLNSVGTAGIIIRLAKWFQVYGGVGYGARVLAWEDINKEWAEVEGSSSKGVAVDAGVILKFGGFFLSGGITTTSFKYTDVELGIGIMF